MSSTLQDVSGLYIKLTRGDKGGIHRIDDDGAFYLLFVFEDMDEAIEKGQKIANLLGVGCKIDKNRL